ncbi:hypothetical protein AAIH27_34935, partial [Pseudomonas aeruginosa]|uniref:hypothetical protein n=1 Tax=Pseudomonas aeruginosa TaxID=287 RepID=UPI0031B7B517
MSNASQAWLRQDAMVGGDHKWLAGGDWTIEHYASLAKSVSAARISHAEGYATPLLDWTQVQRLDTAGARGALVGQLHSGVFQAKVIQH